MQGVCVFGSAVDLKRVSCIFVYRLQCFSVILQTGCCLDEFSACCIAIFMHDFTAKGSPIHFSGYCSLQQIIVLIYELLCRLGHYYCIEVIYMQDADFICILVHPSQRQEGQTQVPITAQLFYVYCLVLDVELYIPPIGCVSGGGSVVIYF